MKKILGSALKILLYLFLFALAALVVYVFVRWHNWPLWTGAVLLFGPLGLILAIMAVRRYLIRRREKRYVKRIIDEEAEKLAVVAEADRQRAIGDLRQAFEHAARIMNRLRPGLFSNPIYALPWYVMLGERGAGKTSALRSAKLNAVQTELAATGELKPTPLCDFWFLDNAVVLDLSGRYATTGDQTAVQSEWEEFLVLLSKYRRREPLSGVVVTVTAERASQADEDLLTELARTQRRRLDEIMRALGARLPIYVLVTKLDTVLGMNDFCSRLTQEERNQAMGVLNTNVADPAEVRVSTALYELADQLKTLRLEIAERDARVDPGVVRFPDAFDRLADGVRLFCRELFRSNPFLEAPIFRGIFFASARQEGEDLSHVTGALADFKLAPKEDAPLPKGIFLHDFFMAALPVGRGLHAPLMDFLSWRNLTRLFALLATLMLTFCFVGLTLNSYLHNSSVLTAFMADITTIPKLSRNFSDNMELMRTFLSELTFMEQANSKWDWPRIGLPQSLVAETKLEKLYSDIFAQGLASDYDSVLRTEISKLNNDTPVETLTVFAAYLADRLHLLSSDNYEKIPPKLISGLADDMRKLQLRDRPLSAAFVDDYINLYLSYLKWNTDPGRIQSEKDQLTTMLRDVIRTSRIELSWLVDWANSQPDIEPVFLEQFWGPTARIHSAGATVPQAYTLAGRVRIQSFVKRMETALKEASGDPAWVVTFNRWYDHEYAAAWESFARSFSLALQWERDHDEWNSLALRMAEPDNPYFLFMETMDRHCDPLKDSPDAPVWLKPMLAYGDMREAIRQPGQAKVEQSIEQKVTSVTTFFQGVKDILLPTAPTGKPVQTPQQPVQQPSTPMLTQRSAAIENAKAFNTYVAALKTVYSTTQTPASALAQAADIFRPQENIKPQPKDSAPPFFAAQMAGVDLGKKLNPEDEGLFKTLLAGPLSFYFGYLTLEAADGLQRTWESTVLGEVANVPDKKYNTVMFNEQTGLVWKYVNGPAAPFLDRNVYGYFPRQAHQITFPFTDEFIRFINRGSKQTQEVLPSYQVDISTKPTDVTNTATEDPYLTTLTLDCTEKVQKLENYNYPLSATFEWKPDSCSTTTLQVFFNSATLTKTYAGSLGFAHFLKEFEFNSKTFSSDDFPASKASLDIIGVKDITVNYTIKGGTPIINLLRVERIRPPRLVARSWSN